MTKKIAAIVTDLVEDVELSSPKEALEKDFAENRALQNAAIRNILHRKG